MFLGKKQRMFLCIMLYYDNMDLSEECSGKKYPHEKGGQHEETVTLIADPYNDFHDGSR